MSILKRPGWANKEILEEGRLYNDLLKNKIGKMFDRLSLGYSPNHVIDKISYLVKKQYGEKYNINDIKDEDIINIANSEYITKGKFTPRLKSEIQKSNDFNTNNDNQLNINQPSNFTSSNQEPVNLSFEVPIETQNKEQIISIPMGSLPSEDSEEKEKNVSQEEIKKHLKTLSIEKLNKHKENWSKRQNNDDFDTLKLIQNEIDSRNNEKQEDAEEVESFNCDTKDSVFNPHTAKRNLNREQNPVNKESVKLSPQAVKRLLHENYLKNKQHKFRIDQKYGM
jgi:hypothetical protein